ncbi:MAG TPA: hypothetical protein VGJ00_00930 [Rhabdochlamydiaceae bacterium]|jgi:hypothetical protein
MAAVHMKFNDLTGLWRQGKPLLYSALAGGILHTVVQVSGYGSVLVGAAAILFAGRECYRQATFCMSNKKKIGVTLKIRADDNSLSRLNFAYLLSGRYPPVVHKKVSNVNELADAIQEVAKEHQIKTLWIHAHGMPECMALSDNSFLDSTNIHVIAPALEQLSSDARIILESCATGDERSSFCIAKSISEISKRAVIAPKGNIINLWGMAISPFDSSRVYFFDGEPPTLFHALKDTFTSWCINLYGIGPFTATNTRRFTSLEEPCLMV